MRNSSERSERREAVHALRLRRALEVVGVLCVLAIVILGLGSCIDREGRASDTLQVGMESFVNAWMNHPNGMDAETLGKAGLVSIEASTAPAWFGEELFDPNLMTSGFATTDWTLVGFVLEDAERPLFKEGDIESGEEEDKREEESTESRTSKKDDAAQPILDALISKGWEMYESPSGGSATFVKSEGRCRWAAVMGVRVADATSIVLHIQHN